MMPVITGRKILVAGGTGLVGANLVPRLHALGARVRATFHTVPPSQMTELFRQSDFTNAEAALELARDMDDMIICAAHTAGIEAMRQRPTADILPNIMIVANLLEAARVHGLQRIVVLSSTTVYQDLRRPIREEELDLNQPPHEAYLAVGGANRFLEQLCSLYHKKFGLKIGILRPTSIYGPHDHFEPGRSHVLPALIRRALAGERPFRVWGSPDVVRDFVYVDDVAEAIVQVLENYCACDPVNVGFGHGITIGETVPLILELCGHSAEIDYDVSQPTAIPYRAVNTDKLDRLQTGSPSRTPLREGLAKTIAWYRQTQLK